MTFSSSAFHPLARTQNRRVYHYHTDDAIPDLLAEGYFDPARNMLGGGDLVICEAAGRKVTVLVVVSIGVHVTLSRISSVEGALETLVARVEAIELALADNGIEV